MQNCFFDKTFINCNFLLTTNLVEYNAEIRWKQHLTSILLIEIASKVKRVNLERTQFPKF
jgi:hypothetical protein